ncbi:MAG: YhjD/YihY/BrkB family envelope integrity protein, partial [Synechococcus sp.]
ALQRGSDRLWQDLIPPPVSSPPLSIQAWRFLQNRLEAFVSVLFVSVLILIAQVFSGLGHLPTGLLLSLREVAPRLVDFLLRTPLFSASRFLGPMIWISLLALLLQRVLADRCVPWLALLPGSVLIGIGLTFLNEVLSLSIISLGSRYQAYGVIGGVLLLSLWVWLIGVIVYFGQCWSVELAASRMAPSSVGDPNRTLV